jgi:regulator of protease activity HflC (stomatin/prohibitin superfamily)
VTNVEIKDVDLDESMIRAIAAQAEAERARRAKVISAEGEYQASQRLADAAGVLSAQPQGMPLRFLQTLTQTAERNAHIIVLPIPVDLIGALINAQGKKD